MKLQHRETNRPSTDALLRQLFSGGYESQEAWKEFLRLYSNLFLKIIWQYEKDRDAVMEKYLFACSKLAANNFAILRSFNPDRGSTTPKLSTWLTIVVKNLCFEAHRVSHGRRRFPRALLRLSEFDRKVFELYFWKGHSPEQIDSMVGTASGGEQRSVGDSLARMTAHFTTAAGERYAKTVLVPYDERDPEVVAANSRIHESRTVDMVPELLLKLSELERAVVHLRFWGDIHAHEISRMLDLKPTRRVYSILQTALKKLKLAALQEASQ